MTDQPRAPVPEISPPVFGAVSSIAGCPGWDCRKTALAPHMIAVKAKAAKMSFDIGRNPAHSGSGYIPGALKRHMTRGPSGTPLIQ